MVYKTTDKSNYRTSIILRTNLTRWINYNNIILEKRLFFHQLEWHLNWESVYYWLTMMMRIWNNHVWYCDTDLWMNVIQSDHHCIIQYLNYVTECNCNCMPFMTGVLRSYSNSLWLIAKQVWCCKFITSTVVNTNIRKSNIKTLPTKIWCSCLSDDNPTGC